MKLALLFLLALTAKGASAITPTQLGLKHPELAYVYQQPHALSEDILGDLLLASSLKTASQGIFYILAGKRGEFYTRPYLEAYRLAELYPGISRLNSQVPFPLKHLPPANNFYTLEIKRIEAAFKRIMQEQKVSRGSFPNWSQRFQEKYQTKLLGKNYPSKLLVCLIRGVCARFMLTGDERKLEAWSLKRKDQSITPEIFFKKALEFSQGDVTQALLTCNNTLSWYSKAPERHLTPLQAKLRPFESLDGHASEDKFGEWYHFFGLMTYGFVKGPTKASAIGVVETIGGRIMGQLNPEVIEESVNDIAPKIGASLSKNL